MFTEDLESVPIIHLVGDPQSSLTSDPGDLMPSSDLRGHQACLRCTHTCTWAKLYHKNKIHKSNNKITIYIYIYIFLNLVVKRG